MDDNRSILSSIYWDSTSINSDSTLPNQDFYTPTGSFANLSLCELNTHDVGSDSDSVTPEFSVIHLPSEETDSNEAGTELIIEQPIQAECTVDVRVYPVIPTRPPPMKLKKSASVDMETTLPKTPEKKDWRRSFAKRISFTKTRIMTTLSMNKHENKSQGNRNVLSSMRNSIRRLRSYDKHKSTLGNQRKQPETIKDTLGSDCEYFNFEKRSSQRNSNEVNDVFEDGKENTPVKPRRQFTQDKYLTGSEEMLQRAYNSLNRKSHIQEDKSMFDLCSTLVYLFESKCTVSSVPRYVPQFVDDCLNAFLEMNTKQIENELLLINKNLANYFDLFSDSLDHIDQAKKYKVEDLLGSNGVCVITDAQTRQRFVALKRTGQRSWVSFTGFLQHIEKDSEPFENQTWVCYPAESITNMYLERDCFEPHFDHSKLILDSLLQLLVLLRGQINADSRPDNIKPSNVLLMSSNLSLICVFDNSDLSPEKDQSALSAININGDEPMRRTYQQSLMNLNAMVNDFLSNSFNSHHIISASYPLDYLFFILLKLHKDINVLLDSI